MAKRKPYNVVAYINSSRIMKESLTATSRAEARAIGREVLKSRGFDPAKVRIEVVPLDPDWFESLFG